MKVTFLSIYEQVKKFMGDNKGQAGTSAILGGVVLIILIGFGQLIVTNVLTTAGIFSGLWPILNTIWPVLAIVILLALMVGAFALFSRSG